MRKEMILKCAFMIVVLQTLLLVNCIGGSDQMNCDPNTFPIMAVADPIVVGPFGFDGRITIPIQMKRHKTIEFILDTGIQQKALLLLHEELLDELGLHSFISRDIARGGGSGKNSSVHICGFTRAKLYGQKLGWPLTVVLGESRLNSSRYSGGVLGGPVFQNYCVGINFDTQKMSLYEKQVYLPDSGWSVLPTRTIMGGIPVINVIASVNDSLKIPMDLVLDLGAKSNLILRTDIENRLTVPVNTIHTLGGIGLRGNVYSQRGRISALQIGKHQLENVIADFPDTNSTDSTKISALAETDCDGILGIGALYRFNMIFDYVHCRVLVKPNKYFTDPFEMNMSGMILHKNGLGKLMVYHIQEDSPAQDLGINIGDQVTRVAYKEISEYSYFELKSLFQRDGEELNVTIVRENVERNYRIILQRMI